MLQTHHAIIANALLLCVAGVLPAGFSSRRASEEGKYIAAVGRCAVARRPRSVPKKLGEHVADALEATLASVPFTGALSVYLEKYYPSYVKKTIDDLKMCLNEHAEQIDTLRCDQDQLAALLSRLPAEYLKEYSKAKRRALVNVVANFCVDPRCNAADAEVFLHLASSLCEGQVTILETISRNPAVSEVTGFAKGGGQRIMLCNDLFPALSRPAVVYLCTDLRQKGLVMPFEENLDAPDSPVYLSYLSLTHFGEEFVSWISSPVEAHD